MENAKKLADIYASLDDFATKLSLVFGNTADALYFDIYKIPSVIISLIGAEDDDPAYYALEDYVSSNKTDEDFAEFVRAAKAGYQE